MCEINVFIIMKMTYYVENNTLKYTSVPVDVLFDEERAYALSSARDINEVEDSVNYLVLNTTMDREELKKAAVFYLPQERG